MMEKQGGDKKEQHLAMQKIVECVRKGLRESELKLSDMSFQNLIVHIYIALKRSGEGRYVPLPEEQLSRISKKKEFEYAQKIVHLLESSFLLEIPETETGYIAIHLAGKRIIEEPQSGENLVISEEIYGIVSEMLDAIWKNYGMDFHDDFGLRMILAAHMVPLSTRVQYNMSLKNPLLKEIQSRYTMAYMMAVTACEVLEKHYHKHILEDEIGYIALHISLALERQRTAIPKKNIVVVCSTGRGSAYLLEHQLKKQFKNYLGRIVTCDVLELKDLDLTEIDYVVTTVPIPYPVNRPILQIKLFLEHADVFALQNLLSGRNEATSLEQYFHPELFLSGLVAENKQDVIRQMVEQIGRIYAIPDDFLESVLERERMAVTSFGNLTAIPHPNRALTDKTFVCVAVLKNSIVWDREKVQFVFLFSLQKGGNKDMQHFMSIAAKLLFNREYINMLIKEPSYGKLMQILGTIEKEMKQYHE